MPLDPVRLTGAAARRAGWRLVRDSLTGMAQNHAEWGPLILISNLVPFTGSLRFAGLGLPLAMAAGAEFNATILSDPAVWRPVAIFPGGPRGSAARRLGAGLARMTGARHAHYRRMILPPLRKMSIDAMGERMIGLAREEIAAWPVNETIDLWERVCRLMQTYAIGLLFGDDRERGYPVAEMVMNMFARKWSLAARGCPINLPGTPYHRFLKEGEGLERCIVDWAAEKRGRLDPADLLSIMVNNPEEDGSAVREETIVGLMPQMFGAVFETCQNALTWTLVLLSEHPRFAGELLAELESELDEKSPSLAAIVGLPFLDAVVKESMRILPPVPTQARVAERDTELAGSPIPRGTRVILSAFVVNRMAERYPEPDSFWPERWAAINPTPFEYPVFSAGPRNCPGYLLGMAMVKVAVATILKRYRIELPARGRIDYRAQPALRPRRPIAATLREQDGGFSRAPITGNVAALVRTLQ